MGFVTELAWGCLDTPVGQVSVACTNAGVARAGYGPPPGGATGPAPGRPSAALLEAALAELAEYFGGRRKAFSVPVDLGRARGSRRTVLSVLHDSVPFGQTITYGGLAARAGLDAAAGPAPTSSTGCWCSRARSRRPWTGIPRACAGPSRPAPSRPNRRPPQSSLGRPGLDPMLLG